MGVIVASLKILRAVTSLLTPFTQTIFPEICILKKLNPSQARRILRYSLGGLFSFMLACAGLLFLFAPYIIKLALGAGYEEAIPALRVMAFAAPMMACDYVLGSQILVPYGLENKQIRAQALGTLFSVALATVLGSCGGVALAAALPVFTETFIALCYFYIVYKYCRQALFNS